jgi:hypothetical protein
MGNATFAGLLLLTITAAITPLGLIAFSLVLASNHAMRNAIAFIAGWVLTIALIAIATAQVASTVTFSNNNAPGQAASIVSVVAGFVLITWGMHRRRHTIDTSTNSLPKPEPAWELRVKTMGVIGAFVLGFLVQPWVIVTGTVADILSTDASATATLIALLSFAVGSILGFVVLLTLAIRHPGSATVRLDKIRNYVDNHRNSVINWLLLITALWLVVRGLVSLV